MRKLGRGRYIRLDICTLTTPAEDTDNQKTNTDETPLHESSRTDPFERTADTPKQQRVEITNHRDVPSPITPPPPSEDTDNQKTNTNQTPLPESPRTEPSKRPTATSGWNYKPPKCSTITNHTITQEKNINKQRTEEERRETVIARRTRDIQKTKRWNNRSLAKLPPLAIPTKIKAKKKTPKNPNVKKKSTTPRIPTQSTQPLPFPTNTLTP